MADSRVRIKEGTGYLDRALVGASSTIYVGDIVSYNADGYLVPAVADGSASGYTVIGIATEYVDNSSGSAGDRWCSFHNRPVFCPNANNSAARTGNGDQVFYAHSSNPTKTPSTSGSNAPIGKQVGWDEDESQPWIDMAIKS